MAVSVPGNGLISWPISHAAWVRNADRLLVEPAPVTVLGIDETRRGRPSWVQDQLTGRWRLTERFETNVVDLAGQGLPRQTPGPHQGRRRHLARRARAGVERHGADRRDGPVRLLPRRRPAGATAGADRRRPLPPRPAAQPSRHRRPPPRHLGHSGRRATRPTRRGPPDGGCCAAGSVCRRQPSSPACGTTASTATAAVRSSPPGSAPRRNSGRCWPPPATAGSGTTSPTGCTASTTGAPTRASRVRAPGRHDPGVVARSPGLPAHRRHERRHRSNEPHRQDRGTHRLRLPQPQQPTPSSTVRLHPTFTPGHRLLRCLPLELEEPAKTHRTGGLA
jgi:hypothetical protein